jgi:hypothetical protein
MRSLRVPLALLFDTQMGGPEAHRGSGIGSSMRWGFEKMQNDEEMLCGCHSGVGESSRKRSDEKVGMSAASGRAGTE